MREACENGTVLYYATDVCYDEPVDVGRRLAHASAKNGKRASNIFVTPHVGGVTVNSYERMGKIVAEYAKKLVKEKRNRKRRVRVHRQLNFIICSAIDDIKLTS